MSLYPTKNIFQYGRKRLRGYDKTPFFRPTFVASSRSLLIYHLINANEENLGHCYPMLHENIVFMEKIKLKTDLRLKTHEDLVETRF